MSETLNLSPAQLKTKTLREALQRNVKTFSQVAANKVRPEQLVKIALGAATRNSLLLDCTPESIVRSVMQGAELGLAPGSALNQAYLVPFKNNQSNVWEAQLIVSAQGLAELAYRSGLVSSITVEVVYEGDDFEFELGLDPKLRHVPKGLTEDPAKITHAYMVVSLKDGAKVFRVMTRSAIERIKARSPMVKSGKRSPWDTDYSEMARKTVAKNGFKFVPKSIEVARAIALDNAQESGDWSDVDFETPEALGVAEDASAISALESKLEGKTEGVAIEHDPLAEPVLDENGDPVPGKAQMVMED